MVSSFKGLPKKNGKYTQGVYQPKNMDKYVGKSFPVYRSSWELKVFMWLDSTSGIVEWASEAIEIPYKNPLKPNTISKYIPDLLVKFQDRSGKQFVEVIEIKPLREALKEAAKTKKDKLAYAVNESKWMQARIWCKAQGISFRVLTERDIFGIK